VVVVSLERLVKVADHRPRLDDLLSVLAGDRVPDDVPPRVATRLLRREAVRGELLEDRRHVREFDPVELDRLSSGEVGVRVAEDRVRPGTASVLVGDLADSSELSRFEHAVRGPDPHHKVPLLSVPLVVQAPPFEPLEPRVPLVVRDRVVPLLGELEQAVADLSPVRLRFPVLDVRWHREPLHQTPS